MANPQKAKGSKYERDVKDYLNMLGFSVERTRVGWTDDRGDLHGIVGPEGDTFVIECKNHATMSLSGWCSELAVEVANAGGIAGAIVHKKRGTSAVSDHYATMPVHMLVFLLRQAGYK